MRIGEMTWTEVREVAGTGVTAVIPLGSIEEHGPHSPMGDYMVIDAIAERAADETGDIVAPTLPFGYSEYFRDYPGTITLRPETLTAVVEDTVDCLTRHAFTKVVIFNGHAGNMPILELLCRKLRRNQGLAIPVISPLQFMQTPEIVRSVYGEGVTLGHGGEPMASVMMVLAPGKVHMEWAGAYGRRQVYGMPTDGLGAINVNGIRVSLPLDMGDVTPETGSLSDPNLASAERGQRLLEYAVSRSVEFLRWYRSVDPAVMSAPA
jgi:creatinine amidohydrolase